MKEHRAQHGQELSSVKLSELRLARFFERSLNYVVNKPGRSPGKNSDGVPSAKLSELKKFFPHGFSNEVDIL